MLAERSDVKIEWLPYVLNLPEIYGDLDERSDLQWRKVKYLYMDVRRIANIRGLIAKGPKKIFDSNLAAAGALFAQKQGCFMEYVDLVFEQFWKRELDIENFDAVAQVAAKFGFDKAQFETFWNYEARDELKAIRTQAEKVGVFGVPTFVLNGELFWGYDRIEYLKKKL